MQSFSDFTDHELRAVMDDQPTQLDTTSNFDVPDDVHQKIQQLYAELMPITEGIGIAGYFKTLKITPVADDNVKIQYVTKKHARGEMVIDQSDMMSHGFIEMMKKMGHLAANYHHNRNK